MTSTTRPVSINTVKPRPNPNQPSQPNQPNPNPNPSLLTQTQPNPSNPKAKPTPNTQNSQTTGGSVPSGSPNVSPSFVINKFPPTNSSPTSTINANKTNTTNNNANNNDVNNEEISVTVSCYENQRKYPLVGWSSTLIENDKRPSWSNENGNEELSLNSLSLTCPNGWTWKNEWSVEVDGSSDKDGWKYAPSFVSLEWNKSENEKNNNNFSSVRRRKWIRQRTLNKAPPIGNNNNLIPGSLGLPQTGQAKYSSTIGTPGRLNNNNNNNAPTNLTDLFQKPNKSNNNTSNPATNNNNNNNNTSNNNGLPRSPTSSFGSSKPLINITTVKPVTGVVKCYECQRYYPLVGWSSNLLPTDKVSPWFDEKGKKINSREDIAIDKNQWKWLDDWRPYIDNSLRTCDKDGWSYAVDWANFKFSPKSTLEHFVRKRTWIRNKIAIPQNNEANSNGPKDFSAFFARLDAFNADLQAEANNADLISMSSATW